MYIYVNIHTHIRFRTNPSSTLFFCDVCSGRIWNKQWCISRTGVDKKIIQRPGAQYLNSYKRHTKHTCTRAHTKRNVDMLCEVASIRKVHVAFVKVNLSSNKRYTNHARTHTLTNTHAFVFSFYLTSRIRLASDMTRLDLQTFTKIRVFELRINLESYVHHTHSTYAR